MLLFASVTSPNPMSLLCFHPCLQVSLPPVFFGMILGLLPELPLLSPPVRMAGRAGVPPGSLGLGLQGLSCQGGAEDGLFPSAVSLDGGDRPVVFLIGSQKQGEMMLRY